MDAVLNWLWQGGVVALAMSVMLVALRGARANVRYTVCWVAVGVVFGLTLMPWLQAATSVEAVSSPRGDAIVSLPHAWWTSSRVILAAMVMWASIHTLQLLLAVCAIRGARHRSLPFPARLESTLPHWRRLRFEGRQARLVLSDSVTRAAVLGWGEPVIAVAPSLVKTLNADDLDRVLIHEWAHVQRRDDVASVFQIAIRIVAGWHPALWWIDRRLHVEREIACDEMTVAITGSARSYAECLMKLSTLKNTPRRIQTAPAIFARSGLRARVVKIVSPDQPIAPVWSRTLAGAIALALFTLSAAVGGVALVEAPAFAASVISATRTLTVAPDPPVAVAPVASSSTEAQRPQARRTARSSRQPEPAVQGSSPSPQPETQSTVSRESHEPVAVPESETSDAPRTTAADPERPSPTPIETRSVAVQPPPNPPTVTSQAQSAWTSAANGGTAIGRKSKDAGVATAGAFKRFASRIAGAF